MSYERTGWVEDEPARLTGRLEVRPAAELGPIIVCLDTSGALAAWLSSMTGCCWSSAKLCGQTRLGLQAMLLWHDHHMSSTAGCAPCTAHHGTAKHGMAWHGMAWHGHCAPWHGQDVDGYSMPELACLLHCPTATRWQGACMAPARWLQRRWRWSACAARTASSASATSTPSGGVGKQGWVGQLFTGWMHLACTAPLVCTASR